MTDKNDESAEARAYAEQMWKERQKRYEQAGKDRGVDSEFDSYAESVRILFDNDRLRDWVFAPFRAAFHTQGDVTSRQVRRTITGVALANAVLAGLPGKLGIGVAVSMALEAFMAFRIAQHVGITSIRTPRDTLRFFGALSATAVVVIWLFKQILGVAFSVFNIVGALPATFLAELTITNLVGILFWVGFREVKKEKPFRIPKSTFHFILRETRNLVTHQLNVLKGALRPQNLKTVGYRFKAWLTGDLVLRQARIRDDVFVAAAMASLVTGYEHALDGPVGGLFLQSIRDLYPNLNDASMSAIAAHFRGYNERQMEGVMNQIKGRLHERMVEAVENSDGDEWIARLHDDSYHPSTDIIFKNTETNETFEVSLKATDNPAYVEHALSRYPNDPVMATREAADAYEGDEGVLSSGLTNEDMENLTEENFDRLLDKIEPSRVDAVGGAVAGASLAAVATLWPFVAAWMRDRITRQQLKRASVKILGTSGMRVIPRLVAALAFGPIYMWYALARGVMSVSDVAHQAANGGNEIKNADE